jgi:hypothetical protein
MADSVQERLFLNRIKHSAHFPARLLVQKGILTYSTLGGLHPLGLESIMVKVLIEKGTSYP